MTATNHALAGAVIALTIKRPELAIPLSFVSHFVLDGIPHFGIHTEDVFKRNHSWQFKAILISDLTLASIVGLGLLILLHGHIPLWILAACMFAGVSPDLVWGFRFFKEIKTKAYNAPKSWFSRFHLWIQWSETPAGAFVELAAFIIMLSFVVLHK